MVYTEGVFNPFPFVPMKMDPTSPVVVIREGSISINGNFLQLEKGSVFITATDQEERFKCTTFPVLISTPTPATFIF